MDFEEFMHQRVKKIPDIECNRPLRIGVVGYSDDKKVDELLKSREWVRNNLSWVLSNMQEQLQYIHGHCDRFELVSGLTDMGVPGIAYHFVTQGKLNQETYVKTVGFACSKAKDFPQFPVDEKHIIGTEWGDESSAFIEYIDALIRIGDGEQSIRECNTFKKLYPNKPIEELADNVISQWVE
jgi:hypothetical protein